MAIEVWRFAVTVLTGTGKAAPATFPLQMPDRAIDEIEIVVPPGPRGEVGFQLASGGIQIIPVTAGAFEVTDDEVIHWPLEDQITTGAWQMIAYNTGVFPHTLGVRFLVRLVAAAAAGALPPAIDPAVLLG